MEDKNLVNISNTHVPDKLYGYGLQVRQMLFELLNCSSDSIVSIEKFDDVGIENSDGKTAIQTKSALSARNPVSDKASDLWKTLYNWLIALNYGELTMKDTLFTLVINVKKDGEIVSKLSKASNVTEALKAYEEIKRFFLDDDGVYIKQSDTINKYVEYFIKEENKQVALYVIEKFKLVIMDDGHTNKIYQEFKNKTYLPCDIQDLIFDKMLGWIEKKVSLQVEKNQIMQISKVEFQDEMVLTQIRVNQNKALIELAPNPTNKQVELEQREYKTYIRQLQIVEIDYDDQLEAINDYLKAVANRTIWAVKGDVNEEIITQYFENLKKSWKTKKNIVELDKEAWSETKKGKYLYNVCMDSEVNVEALVTPRFFKNGCYHELADQEKIGWHPEYKKKLREEEKND